MNVAASRRLSSPYGSAVRELDLWAASIAAATSSLRQMQVVHVQKADAGRSDDTNLCTLVLYLLAAHCEIACAGAACSWMRLAAADSVRRRGSYSVWAPTAAHAAAATRRVSSDFARAIVRYEVSGCVLCGSCGGPGGRLASEHRVGCALLMMSPRICRFFSRGNAAAVGRRTRGTDSDPCHSESL
jgi:hypothetical protein